MRYLTLAEVIELHRLVIAQSGGARGVRTISGIESALAQPQMTFGGDELYPTIETKAAAPACSLVMNHPFIDGNKRSATPMEAFLVLNGWELDSAVDDAENVMLQLAAGQFPRSDLERWVQQHIRPFRPADDGDA